jgi:hypothetical protein
MAEIKIEKKKPVWPWVLAAIVILALVIVYFVNDDNDQTTRYTQRETTVTDTVRTRQVQDHNAVDSYVRFVNEEQGRMGEDHQYTSEALQRLTAAVRAKADEKGHDIQVDLNQAQQAAQEITIDPEATHHAHHIREAADALTRAMTNMQQAYYPEMEENAQELRSTTERIDPDQETLQQRDAIKSFFEQSAELLEEMD